MSFYTKKFKNCTDTSKCNHYRKAIVQNNIDNRYKKCNNSECNKQENCQSHVHKHRSTKIYITPLCASCNNSNNLSWMTYLHDNFVLVSDCDCCNCDVCN